MNVVVPDFEFRPLAEADIPAVRALHARSFAALAQGSHDAVQIAGHVGLIEAEAYAEELRHCHIELALQGGRIVATAGWIEAGEPGVGRIRKVFVDPDLARQGLGSRMVRRAEAAAHRAACRRIIVRANINAVPLYAQLGYVETGRVQMDVGGGVELPAVMMERQPDAISPR